MEEMQAPALKRKQRSGGQQFRPCVSGPDSGFLVANGYRCVRHAETRRGEVVVSLKSFHFDNFVFCFCAGIDRLEKRDYARETFPFG